MITHWFLDDSRDCLLDDLASWVVMKLRYGSNNIEEEKKHPMTLMNDEIHWNTNESASAQLDITAIHARCDHRFFFYSVCNVSRMKSTKLVDLHRNGQGRGAGTSLGHGFVGIILNGFFWGPTFKKQRVKVGCFKNGSNISHHNFYCFSARILALQTSTTRTQSFRLQGFPAGCAQLLWEVALEREKTSWKWSWRMACFIFNNHNNHKNQQPTLRQKTIWSKLDA